MLCVPGGLALPRYTAVALFQVVYAFPLWGLLHRAHQQHAEFFGATIGCEYAEPFVLVRHVE